MRFLIASAALVEIFAGSSCTMDDIEAFSADTMRLQSCAGLVERYLECEKDSDADCEYYRVAGLDCLTELCLLVGLLLQVKPLKE